MTVRQTNVIWLGFIMATSMLSVIREEQIRRSAKREDEDENGGAGATIGVDPLLEDVSSMGKHRHMTGGRD